MNAIELRFLKADGPRFISVAQSSLLLLFACFLAGALACQRFFHPLLLAGFQVKGVTFHFLNDVLGLNLTLKTTQRIFERLAFLQSNFCQETTPPDWSWLNSLVIAR
jgi:hypothetical protein